MMSRPSSWKATSFSTILIIRSGGKLKPYELLPIEKTKVKTASAKICDTHNSQTGVSALSKRDTKDLEGC